MAGRRMVIVLIGTAVGALAAIETPRGEQSAAPGAGLKMHHIKAAELPAPTSSGPNPSKVVPKPEGVDLVVPPGFAVAQFAEGFKRPRWAVEAPSGDVFVSDSTAGSIFVLQDRNGNHVIEDGERTEFATGLKQPFGMAFRNDALYVANTDAVMRFDYRNGQAKAAGEPAKVTDLPSGPKGHWTRNIDFAPDGRASTSPSGPRRTSRSSPIRCAPRS